MKQVKYSDIRDSIKSGDRFEFASKSILGSLIRWFTKEEVNHTALALSIDEYSDYCGNRKFFLEANSNGVELNTISRSITNYKGKIYYTPLLPIYDIKRKSAADWALQQVGIKYDYGNLFKNAISRVNADVRKLFCSEFYFIDMVAAEIISWCKLINGKVYDSNGASVKTPRPGEFDRFPIFGETVEVTA